MPFIPHRESLSGSLLPLALVLLAALLLTAPPASAGDLIHRDLPTAAVGAQRVIEPSDLTEGVLARETVRVDPSALAAGPETLWLELTPGEWRLAFLTELERRSDGGLVWRGRFAEDDPEYRSITLSLHAGVLYGDLEAGSVDFALRPVGGATSLITVAAGAPLRCAVGSDDDLANRAAAAELGAGTGGGDVDVDVEPPEPRPAADGSEAAAAAAATRLHFLLLYSPSLGERWGGAALRHRLRPPRHRRPQHRLHEQPHRRHRGPRRHSGVGPGDERQLQHHAVPHPRRRQCLRESVSATRSGPTSSWCWRTGRPRTAVAATAT